MEERWCDLRKERGDWTAESLSKRLTNVHYALYMMCVPKALARTDSEQVGSPIFHSQVAEDSTRGCKWWQRLCRRPFATGRCACQGAT